MMIRDNRPTINFLDSYRAHYGGQEDVVIQRLEPLSGNEPALRLTFACGRRDFSHFLFSVGESPFYPSMDNTFIIRFGKNREWQGKMRPVYENGEGPVTYAITITCKTAEAYQAEGEVCSTRFTVTINPPLDFQVRSPESWVALVPTAEERRFAEATWGKDVVGAKTDYEKARQLAKVLSHELWPHSGTPMQGMEYYSPFEMYRAMVSGKSKGFCVQFAMIFVHACKCFDLIARNMHIERPVRYGEQCWILLSGMHSTTEVFDRALDRWIFMDLRFYCLGAYIGDEGPLSLGEFHLFMCQPHWRNRLRFQIYDMETRTEKRLSMAECPRPDIHFYGGWNTVFHVGRE